MTTKNKIDNLDSNGAKIVKTSSDLLVYTVEELLTAFKDAETDYLWDNLIPRSGTSLLVGPPDIGKSQMAKELALMVASGMSHYLGLRLHTRHKRALYVSTEDGEEAVKSSLERQVTKHQDYNKDNLCLGFLTDENLGELVRKLIRFCEEKPLDLIVIDAFGDIFSGNDANNNTQMRKDIKLFDEVVRKHKVAIVFVHHINKAGYKKNPSQELIQGGSGLTQKVRSALFLSRNEQGQKFFNVAKGNYTPKFYKENRLPVDFDEETLTFEVMGDWEPIDNTFKREKNSLSDSDLYMIFRSNGLTFTALCAKIIAYLKVSQSTAERRVGKLVSSGAIIKEGELYYLSQHQEESTTKVSDELTLTSISSTSFEGEGEPVINMLPDVDITFNPQTPIKNEGEGLAPTSSNQLFDLFDGVKSDFSDEQGNGVPSTVNHQLPTGNEGEGFYEDIINSAVSEPIAEYIQDPMIGLIHQKVSQTDYCEDENFIMAMEDFYINISSILSGDDAFEVIMEGYLQDMYSISPRQSKLLLRIFLDLKLIRIDEIGIVHKV